MKHRIQWLLLLVVLSLGYCSKQESKPIIKDAVVVKKTIDYPELKKTIQAECSRIRALYESSQSLQERRDIIQKASSYLYSMFTDSLLPAWYGTRWDFNGMTRTPGKGAIACGSFVVFTLQDLGFKIPSRMLRQPSENIIKNLCPKSEIHHFPQSMSLQKIEQWFKKKGVGVYIVGLHNHVGFIIVKDDKVTFCHSSYFSPPLQVVNEPLLSDNPFTHSHYKVVGRILTENMVEKWITGKRFEMRYDDKNRRNGLS